jgi:hypothetical protein
VAKPLIGLSSPSVLYAGGAHQLGFEITLEEELRVDYVEAKLVGRQGWEVGSGKSRVSHRVTYPTLVSRFMNQGFLTKGANRFTMQFQLPRDMPPSHEISPAYAQLDLHLRIAIPWWFDHKFRWTIPVHVPPPQIQRTPLATRSTPASSDKPRIEVSLPSTRLIVGEFVEGAVAVFHLDDKKPRDIDFQLVPHFVLLGRGTRERTGAAYGWTVTLPAGSAGQAVPFQIAIPKTAVPSFQSASHFLRWSLTARSGSFFGSKVAIVVPLEIYDQSASATTARLTGAPRLADERIGAVFARFAGSHGWQGHRLNRDDPDDARIAIERESSASTLRMTYAYRDDGTFLVSRMSTPSLGLGLSVTPSSSLRHMFWKDIEVDIAAWDRDHHVTARYPDQTLPVLKAIVPTMVQRTALGTLVQWTDDAMVFERAVPSVEEADLAAAGTALEAMAATLAAARFHLTPPPSVSIDVPAWQALAQSLGAELGIGDLSIDGKLGHVPVTLGLRFDREDTHRPVAITAGAGNPELASAAARGISVMLARPASDALGSTNLSEAVVEQLTRWPTEIVDLKIAEGVATAELPIPDAAPNQLPEVSAAKVKELAQGLVAVLAAIDPGAGPYR